MQRNERKQGISLPRLPRSEWQAHANFPQQALLLGSHDNFRKVSSHLVSESMSSWSASPRRAPLASLHRLFRRWKAAMKSHEGYEEGKLYPFLHAKYGVSLALLELHHKQLGLAEEHVFSAYEQGDALKFAHELKKHDQILVPHLAQEEEAVIPLLLTMERADFERYSRGDIASLLRDLERTQSHG